MFKFVLSEYQDFLYGGAKKCSVGMSQECTVGLSLEDTEQLFQEESAGLSQKDSIQLSRQDSTGLSQKESTGLSLEDSSVGAQEPSTRLPLPACIRQVLELNNQNIPQWLQLFMDYPLYDEVIEELNAVQAIFTIGLALVIASVWYEDDKDSSPMNKLMECCRSMANRGQMAFNVVSQGIRLLIVKGRYDFLETCFTPCGFDPSMHDYSVHCGNAIIINVMLMLGSPNREVQEQYLYSLMRRYGSVSFATQKNWIEYVIFMLLMDERISNFALVLDLIVMGCNQGWLPSVSQQFSLSTNAFKDAVRFIVSEKKTGYLQHVLYLCYKIKGYYPHLFDWPFVSHLLEQDIALWLKEKPELQDFSVTARASSANKNSQDVLMYLAPFVHCPLFNEPLNPVEVFKTFYPHRSIADIIVDSNHIAYLRYLPRSLYLEAFVYALEMGHPILPSLWNVITDEAQGCSFQYEVVSLLSSYQTQGNQRLFFDFIDLCLEKNFIFIVQFLMNQPGFCVPVLMSAVRSCQDVSATTSTLLSCYEGDLFEVFSLTVSTVVEVKRRQRHTLNRVQLTDFISAFLSTIEGNSASLVLDSLAQPIVKLLEWPFLRSMPQLALLLNEFSHRHGLQCKIKCRVSIPKKTIPLLSLHHVKGCLSPIVAAFGLCERAFLHADSRYQPLTIAVMGTWLVLCHKKQISTSSGSISTLWSFVDFLPAATQTSGSQDKPHFSCQQRHCMSVKMGQVYVKSKQRKTKGQCFQLSDSHLTFKTASGQYFTTDPNMRDNVFSLISMLGNIANDKGYITVAHQLTLLGEMASKLESYLKHQQSILKSKPASLVFNVRLGSLMNTIDQVKKDMCSAVKPSV